MVLGENYFQQLQNAKDSASDSLDYKQRVEAINEERRAATVQRASGCLIRDCQVNGYTSGTPRECPVDECGAIFDKNALAVENQDTCVSPDFAPQPKYPAN